MRILRGPGATPAVRWRRPVEAARGGVVARLGAAPHPRAEVPVAFTARRRMPATDPDSPLPAVYDPVHDEWV